MTDEYISNAVKSFRQFIMFKYKSENTAKNYGSAVASLNLQEWLDKQKKQE